MANNSMKYNGNNAGKALPDVFKELEQMRKTQVYVDEENNYVANVPTRKKSKKIDLSNLSKIDLKNNIKNLNIDEVKSKAKNIKSKIDEKADKVKQTAKSKTSKVREKVNKVENRVNDKVGKNGSNLYIDGGFDLPKSSLQIKQMAEMERIAAENERKKEQERIEKEETKKRKQEIKEHEKEVKKQNKEYEKQARKEERERQERELYNQVQTNFYNQTVKSANTQAIEQLYIKAQMVNQLANGVQNTPIDDTALLKEQLRQKKRFARQVQREKFMSYVRTRSFRDPVAIGFLIAIIILGAIIVHGFFTDQEVDGQIEQVVAKTKRVEKRQVVGGYEKNYNAINLSQILEENIQTIQSKELITIEREVPFETEYTQNSKLPLDEQFVTQVGQVGKEEVTFIRTFQNDEAINDNIININTITVPTVEKIEVGTNQYLANMGAHLNDIVYLKDNTPLMAVADSRGQEIGILVKYYDVRLLDILDNGWAQVKIYDYIGYCDSSMLISKSQDATIVDKSRRQKIVKNVNENMSLNVKSGLTAQDYQVILSNNSQDVYNTFSNNAMAFYNAEQQYDINGIFLAAIGIHESAWGTSTIALNKNNLFGYGAYDSDPYNMSLTFDDYEDGINTVAKALVKYYLNVPGSSIFDNQSAIGSYYNGPTVAGVNVRYASDKEWHTKVYNYMVKLYSKIAPN